MHLRHTVKGRQHGRNDRFLKRPRRGNDVLRRDRPLGCLDPETCAADAVPDVSDLHPAMNRGFDLPREILEIGRDAVLGRKGVRSRIRKNLAGETVVPGRAVGHKGIPPLRAPSFGNAGTFQHHMRDTASAQMRAHRQPGLTATYDNRIRFFG